MEKQNEEAAAPVELTKEDQAFLINAIWISLQAPEWKKNNSEKLFVTIGGAIVSNKKLNELDEKTFNQIFPHLMTIATSLGQKIMQRSMTTLAKLQGQEQTPEPAAETKPAVQAEEEKKNVTSEATP